VKKDFLKFPQKKAERNAWLFIPSAILGVGFGLFLNGYWLVDKFPAESRQLLFITTLASLLGMAGYFLLLRWMRDHSRPLPMAQCNPVFCRYKPMDLQSQICDGIASDSQATGFAAADAALRGNGLNMVQYIVRRYIV
jgi:hypothetical protein